MQQRGSSQGGNLTAAVAGSDELTATVLIPSYNRPEKLCRCLDSLLAGTRTPEQIIVVLRDCDVASHRAVGEWVAEDYRRGAVLQVAAVDEPGPMAAANVGLKLATGDVVCFTDDDCVVTRCWLERLLAHYAERQVIGVGGRDIVHHGDRVCAHPQPVVGRLTWYGRIIGNHHQPDFDEPREVHHLKGANMSFRRHALQTYDLILRSGVYHEIDAALGAMKLCSGRIIYDPQAAVHHYPAPRHYGHARDSESVEAVTDIAHDCACVMLKHLTPMRRAGFWLFAVAIGQHRRYGLLRMIAMLPTERMRAVRRWRAAMRGLFAARRTLRRTGEGKARDER